MQDMILLAAFVQGMLSTALQFSAMRQSCTAQHGTTQQSTSRHSTAQTRHNSTTWCCSHANAICPGVTPFLSASFLTLSTSFMFCTTLEVTTAAHPGTGRTWCKLQGNPCMSMLTVRHHMQSKCSLPSVMLLGCGQEKLTIQVKAVAAAAPVIGRNDAQCRGMHQQHCSRSSSRYIQSIACLVGCLWGVAKNNSSTLIQLKATAFTQKRSLH